MLFLLWGVNFYIHLIAIILILLISSLFTSHIKNSSFFYMTLTDQRNLTVHMPVLLFVY